MQHFFIPSPSAGIDWSEFLGAFAGAFFAFIFGLVAYRITKRYERFVQHQHSLVKLDRMCNRHLDNLSMLEELLKNITLSLKNKNLTNGRLFKLEVVETLEMEIGSIDLVNEFFSYRAYVDRLNFEVLSTNHFLTRCEDFMIGGQNLDRVNTSLIIDGLNNLQDNNLPLLTKELRYLLALTRIHLRKIGERKPFLFFYGVVKDAWDPHICKDEIESELDKLDKEIEEVKKNSLAKILTKY